MTKISLNNLIFYLLGFFETPEELEQLAAHIFDRADELRERLAEELAQAEYEAAERAVEERRRDYLDRLADLKSGGAIEVHKP